MDPIKNLPSLIDAAETILERHSTTTFVIAGDGAEKVTLENAVAAKGLGHAFRFPGFVKDIPALLAVVDIVVHPSLSEGVPNTLLEAMAAEKPIVASRVGGIAEVVDHDNIGVLVPPARSTDLAEALNALIADDAQRENLGKAARRHVLEKFSRTTNITQIENLFEQVASSPPRPRPRNRSSTIPLTRLLHATICCAHKACRRSSASRHHHFGSLLDTSRPNACRGTFISTRRP